MHIRRGIYTETVGSIEKGGGKMKAEENIKPKELYHMIFYAALTVMSTILAVGTPDNILVVIVTKIPCAVIAVYALWKMHETIEGA